MVVTMVPRVVLDPTGVDGAAVARQPLYPMSDDRPPQPAPAGSEPHGRRSVVVSVCTFRRNDELGRLLESLVAAAHHASAVADVGVVVVDDNPDGRARPVAGSFDDRFPLGVTYVHSGRQNISRARNLGLEAAVSRGEWVAMTDDDVVVPVGWIAELDAGQRRTGALAVTGPMVSRFPTGSPGWLEDEPFATMGVLDGADDQPIDTCATHNSMVSSRWLREHPGIRFSDDLGVLGGEDMVFYRRAIEEGLTACYSSRTVVVAVEPQDRATLRYQLRRALWIGNSEFVTNRRLGAASRPRLGLRGGRRMARAVGTSWRAWRAGEAPQVRFAAARVATGLGLVAGSAGIELRHR